MGRLIHLRRLAWSVFFSWLCFTLLACGGRRLLASPPVIVWASNADEALASAKAQGRPVIIDFYADWCATCLRLDTEVWTHPNVRTAAQRFTTVRVDMTQTTPDVSSFAKTYGVNSLPAVLFVTSAGEVLAMPRILAYTSAAMLVQAMRQVP